MELTVQGLRVSLQGTQILRDVSLGVEAGEFLSLLGPSGCGKSTLLKTVAGLLPLDAGRLLLGGQDITQKPPHQRGAVIVFQDMRLFPHMTAAENVAYPLKLRGVSRRERAARAEALLERVQLSGLGNRAPAALSGGQQQRVALARALAARPRLLLLNEPFSSLDEDLREDMRQLVLSLHRELSTTTVLVTHDQQEALAMSDHVALMFDGQIVQHGTPEEVYARPVSPRAADYFGGCFYLSGQVAGGQFTSSSLRCPAPLPGGPCRLMLRPAALALGEPGPLSLRLVECRFRGADVLTRWVTEDGAAVDIPMARRPAWPIGTRIPCRVAVEKGVFYPGSGEGVLP